ncbi:MAG: glycerol kinase GlpK [Clostridia bacterium]|nr:glycerol kinase GlpK [Clostridia bacterium]
MVKKRYILALDEGTTSARAVVYDCKSDSIIASVNTPIDLIYRQSGWVEQDARDLWGAQFGALNEVIAKSGVSLDDVNGLGITNQRETVLLWDKKTGIPLGNAIVWQCRRTAEFCNRLKERGLGDYIRKKTGLVIDAYFSASKIKWILDNTEGARERAKRGELCCGTVDSYLIYRLTEGAVHVTDVTNASRTMLMDINTLRWDRELLELFDIPEGILPRIVHSDATVGETTVLNKPIKICGIAGDQQAALFGQNCFDKGSAKNTYGTGCFILMNTGDEVCLSDNSLVSTVAWVVDNKPTYALEGSVFNAGSSVQWLRDSLGLISSSAESEAMARLAVCADKSLGSDGVYVVPAFTGLGAPYWNQAARGIIVGITRNTNKYHIIRATLESMAYSTKDVISLMESDTCCKMRGLCVDGGACKNDFLMQFQADILNAEVVRPSVTESTVLGAVYLSGLASGVFASMEDIAKHRSVDRVFRPQEDIDRQKLYRGWKRAVARSLDWAIGEADS